jgi:intracellular septation protein A
MVSETRAAPTLDQLNALPAPTWRLLIGRGGPQFAFEGVVPAVVFYAVWREGGLVPAVVVGTVCSLAIAAWQTRRGLGGAMALVTVTFVLIQAVVGLAAHSATVYLAQPVVLSACWGIAYFGSVAIGRPLIGVIAGTWYPFPDWFRASPTFRREFGMQSVVWGVYCLARAGVRIVVLLGSGVGAFLVVSAVTGFPLLVALIGWGLWHARRTFSSLSNWVLSGDAA